MFGPYLLAVALLEAIGLEPTNRVVPWKVSEALMMMVTICPLETSSRVLKSANSGAGSKNDQAWVARSRCQTRVRVPALIRSPNASVEGRVTMSQPQPKSVR